ncbi:MAG: Ger(x)C family spore germination protein [Firmicutes bacterium]|nr:Ger(x)C family spore germination protein [Bacillota bacterium]
MRIRLLILCVALLLALSGCSGAIELQETGIVMGIGIDASEDGESVEITVEIANYTEDSSKSADSPQDNIFTSKGRTITDAINNLKSTVDKYLFWGHNKVIIFGEKILQAGINAHIDAFIRNAEMRPTAFILACEGRAAEIFNGKSGLASSVSFGIAGMLERNGKQTRNKKLGCNIQEFSENMLNQYPANIVPYLKFKSSEDTNEQKSEEKQQEQQKKKKEIEIESYAVISAEGKMVSKLDKKEQLGAFLLLDKLESEIITVENNSEKFSLELYSSKISIDYTNNVFRIELNADCKMYEVFIPDKVNSKPDLELVEQLVKNYVSEAILSAFSAERNCREDFLQLGQQIYRMPKDKSNSIEFSVQKIAEPELKINIDVVFSGEIFNTI